MFIKLLIICVFIIEIVNTYGRIDALSIVRRRMNAPALGDLLVRNGIVPQIIDRAPANEIKVAYSNGNQVTRGNQLTPLAVRNQPAVEWSVQPNVNYTLAMVDPDAPSRASPTSAQWRHWLVVDIPGNDIARGRVLTPYQGSQPPRGTGLHRYIFLVYRQSRLLGSSVTVPEFRARFDIRQFANSNSLGQPVAANFFQARAN